MKNLYPLFLLAALGCNSSPTTPAHEQAVSDFIRTNANDPASYTPVRFSAPSVYRVQDENELKAQEMEEKAQISFEAMKSQADREVRMVRLNASAELLKPIQDAFKESEAEVKEFRRLEDSLKNANDTTRLGTVVIHAFRSKNKMGGLVLDSARFLIRKDGKVSVL